jgi:hypothetical protein
MRGSSPPFIVFQGRFPGKLYMKTSSTNFKKTREIFPPRLRGMGTHPGLVDPLSGLDPLGTIEKLPVRKKKSDSY